MKESFSRKPRILSRRKMNQITSRKHPKSPQQTEHHRLKMGNTRNSAGQDEGVKSPRLPRPARLSLSTQNRQSMYIRALPSFSSFFSSVSKFKKNRRFLKVFIQTNEKLGLCMCILVEIKNNFSISFLIRTYIYYRLGKHSNCYNNC